MDRFYKVGDGIEFPPGSGYEYRAEMRGQIMVSIDEQARPGEAVLVKDAKVVAIFKLGDESVIDNVYQMLGSFDAMMINPVSVPDGALTEALAKTQELDRKQLS